MEEALPVLGGGARLDPGPGGGVDPEVGDTLGGGSRGVGGGHDAVDQGNILLGVAHLDDYVSVGDNPLLSPDRAHRPGPCYPDTHPTRAGK